MPASAKRQCAPAPPDVPQPDVPLGAVLPRLEGPPHVDGCLLLRFHDDDLDVMQRAVDLLSTVRAAAPSVRSLCLQETVALQALDYPEAYRLLDDPWELPPESPWAPFAEANLDGAVGVADHDALAVLVEESAAWDLGDFVALHVRAVGADGPPVLEWELMTKSGERWVFGSIDVSLLRLAALRRAPAGEHATRLAEVLMDRPALAARELARTPTWRLAAWTAADLAPWLAHDHVMVREAGLRAVPLVAPHAVAPSPGPASAPRRRR